MSIGISQWLRMETRELALGELAETDGGDVVQVLSFHDETSFDVLIGDDVLDVLPMQALRPASHGAFVVVTTNYDGDESAHYFPTIDAAHQFAGQTDDEVVSFEGLMD